MGLVVDFHQAAYIYRRVTLCCRKTFMSQQFLNAPQIRSGIQKMRGERMAEGMGADLFRDACGHDILVQNPLNGSGMDPPVILAPDQWGLAAKAFAGIFRL
jgi:hypothetical protein